MAIVIWYEDHYSRDRYLPVFSPKTMLESLWANYKKDYVEPNSGRTIDTARNNNTTSEAEGYTMLRAVWIDDRATFDASWKWTKKNLMRRDDHLFAWLYGKRSDGTEGILTSDGGMNTASDADTDIALALIFAYSRWQDPVYLKEALTILPDLWNKEVFLVNGRPYLSAHNLDLNVAETDRYVNPSYFAPYAYRIFGEVDKSRNWRGLIDTSYEVLDKSIVQPLDRPTSAHLPPDWVKINSVTGAVGSTYDSNAPTTFGYNAIRIPWRIALDWEWYGEPRAKVALEKLVFLRNAWLMRGSLYAIYQHDGEVSGRFESPATYGGTMGYFLVADPGEARNVYLRKLQSLYNPTTQSWEIPLSYYDSNIVWFGMALYERYLPNLFALNFKMKP
jgi:endoglucanase